MTGLVLGPLLRHVDGTSGVRVGRDRGRRAGHRSRVGEHHATRPTFRVHGHHYALVCVDGLEPGSRTPYTVERRRRAGVAAEPDSPYPPSRDPDARPRTSRCGWPSAPAAPRSPTTRRATSSTASTRCAPTRCGWPASPTPPHDDDPDPDDQARWPDLVLFLGDQVYADETTDEMREFIESRRNIEEPPGTELKDYEEYAHLYKLAWSDPANRWLLSTLPSAMIFDDHDIRDDWNTSADVEAARWRPRDWWHDRIVAGLGVVLGPPAPRQHDARRARRRRDLAGDRGARRRRGEFDATDLLDEFAERADQQPESYRWSYAREFGARRPAGGRGLAGGPGARPDEPLDARRRRDGLARRADARRRRPPARRHVPAVPAQPRASTTSRRGARRWPTAAGVGAARRLGEKLRQDARPRALGGVPGRLPEGRGMTLEVARGERGRRTADGHVPLRRRAPQLRLGGRPTAATGGRRTTEPDHPGGLLPDPQPDAAAAAVPGRGPGVRRRGADRARRGPVGEGARRCR